MPRTVDGLTADRPSLKRHGFVRAFGRYGERFPRPQASEKDAALTDVNLPKLASP